MKVGKILLSFLLTIGLVGTVIPTNIVSAKTSSYTMTKKAGYKPAVYNGLWEFKQIKLNNGLTVSHEKANYGYTTVPIILYKGKKVWSLLSVDKEPLDNGSTSFTVTTNGDTFLSHVITVGAGSVQYVVGIHANGKVFLSKKWAEFRIESKFLSADTLETAFEQQNTKWNPAYQSNAEQHTGIWRVKRYKLLSNGTMKLEKDYQINRNN
jgi:hypothetical protein